MLTQTLQKSKSAYTILLNHVRQTLIEGQRRIEEERVATYWQTGKIINKHILKYSDRADYGAELFKNLASDLNTEISILFRCVQFVKTYPKLPNFGAHRNFTWSHYLKLIAIADEKKRQRLEKATERNAWSSRELIARIKADRLDAAADVEEAEVTPVKQTPLIPQRGKLFTYKIVKRPTLGTTDEPGLLLDLGFGIFRNVDSRVLARFKEGDIVQSTPKGPMRTYKFSAIAATEKELYTYTAFIEKVIDGDTLKVRFDLGFDTWVRDTLRLRGLDCPEMDTKEGVAAKAFVQTYIKEADMVIVRSSRSDKYARFLADIFIPQDNPIASASHEAIPDLYLNNMLLENGYAVRM